MNNVVDFTIHDSGNIGTGIVNTVVGNAVLGKVVGANFLGAIAGTNEGLASIGGSSHFFGFFLLEKA